MSAAPERIVFVTPAGRRRYLELLRHYVLNDAGVDEWQLWDNCRDPSDSIWIEDLARSDPRIRIVRRPAADGTNRAVNQFYSECTDRNAFYVKLDDDIVFLPPRFAQIVAQKAAAGRGQILWWSPLVVNNAICTALLKYRSRLNIPAPVMAAASCPIGWANPHFAESLHRAFLHALESNAIVAFRTPDATISTARYSINCIGFFGADVADLGAKFCPPDVDDEEWISAILPSIVGRPGRILGDIAVAHHAYFTQEAHLSRTDILDRYYKVAGLTHSAPAAAPVRPSMMRTIVRRLRRTPDAPAAPSFPISIADDWRPVSAKPG